MLGRLLQVIQWISLAVCCLGIWNWIVAGIIHENPMRKSDYQLFSLFIGQYIGYVVVLWIIKQRWIWFPWQRNKN